MIEVREVVGRKVCKSCRWVKYYGAGIWLCVRDGKRLEEGVLEVNPLQAGCEWWEEKGMGGLRDRQGGKIKEEGGGVDEV